MKAECITKFKDIDAGRIREVGERFELTPERFKAINSAGHGKLIREVRVRAKKSEGQ